MSTLKLSIAALGLFMTTAAFAADPAALAKPTPAEESIWKPDFAFGAKGMSDYNFRGISQSNLQPSWNAYGEARYGWLYAGVAGYGVDLPTKPDAEVDLYFGIRPTLGPVNFDFGATYYYYPGEQQVFVGGAPFSVKNTDFWEPYAKVSYTWEEKVTVGANLFYAPDWLGSGASGTYYSGTLKINLPYDFAISGELGHYTLGRTGALLGNIPLPDYTYWNVGISYTYKAITLDARYHDTNLSKSNCFILSGDLHGLSNGGRSNWCGQAFVASIGFDLTASSFLK